MRELFNLLKDEIEYFKKLKVAIGDIHGHIHSLAVRTAKIYLAEKHPEVKNWKLSETYGKGIDIVGKDGGGRTIVAGEVKTTFRSKKEVLGSQQRSNIGKDFFRLIGIDAKHKYFFIIDKKNKEAMKDILRITQTKIENIQPNPIKIINLFE